MAICKSSDPLAQAVLENLVTTQGTKSAKSPQELAIALNADRDVLDMVLQKLTSARLVRGLRLEGSPELLYELTHEYLIGALQRGSSLSIIWEKANAALDSQPTLYRQAIQELTSQLSSAWAIPVTEYPAGSDSPFLTLALDCSKVFQQVRIPSTLPIFFPQYRGIGEAELSRLKELLGPNQRIALLVVFGGKDDLAQVQRLLQAKLRQPYAYDIIALGREDLQRVTFVENPQQAIRRLVLSAVDLVTVSPFTVIGPTPDNVFFGRETELRELVEHLAETSFALIGGRRIGKTSVLGRLHRVRLPAAGFQSIYHDCSTTPSYEDFCNAEVRSWKPETSTGVRGNLVEWLKLPPNDRPLVLLLDEADKLVPDDRLSGWRLFNELRALTNTTQVQVVLSGERTLRDALRDSASPLFNFANEISLGPLDFRAVEELILQPMGQLEIELANEAAIVSHIYDFTSGHPNIAQRICRRLIERLNEQGTRHITLDDVNAVIEDPGFQREDFLSIYWEAATSLEKIISLLMSDDESVHTLRTVRQALAERCNLRPKAREVDDALQRLVDLRSILKRTPTGYEFAVAAFPRVVAGTMTLDDMLEVLVEDYADEQAKGEA